MTPSVDEIGAVPIVRLSANTSETEGPAFIGATVLPGRGMMLLQAQLRLASGEIVDALMAPSEPEAAAALNGGPDDFCGNRSFSFGGAVLAPFANRIRGALVPGRRAIETQIAGHAVELPANWSGKAPGAEPYAMHGLVLASAFAVRDQTASHVSGHLLLQNVFSGWPGKLGLEVTWRLEAGALCLEAVATNLGREAAPVGFGWHPYFKIQSGQRADARLWLSASSRALVDNYDSVLPTGVVEPVAGSAYDFTASGGRALSDQYLDDSFTDLSGPGVVAELRDPASGIGLQISSPSPDVRALQVYSPPGEAFVVIEPQFNLADPYGSEWKGRDTGMHLVQPGERVRYEVLVTPFTIAAGATPR